MPSGSPPDQTSAAFPRGATIGRYVVLGLVGRGGMGEVYAAYDHELDRKVAVKLLRVKPGAGLSLAEGRQRTLREAQAIARLSHPNVVVVYDVGTFEDQVFIAMEFVDGNTVTYWLQAKTRSSQEIIDVFAAAGRGLQAAHDKELVHRDFKPDNVMVGRDGGVRVMDFGLARQVGAGDKGSGDRGERSPFDLERALVGRAADGAGLSTLVINPAPEGASDTQEIVNHSGLFDTQLTRTGAMMGTPAYMAPEQFLGTATDARTDQFSFSVALYEALYGERPFGGNSMFALTANVVQGNVKDAPANAKVPQWVRKILLRGLRPEAAERFPSMKALIEALGKDPAIARRRRALALAAVLLPLAVGLGVRQSLAGRQDVGCGGAAARLADVWEVAGGKGAPESPRQATIHRAFLATGKAYAADAFVGVTRVLTTYAQNWAGMYRDVCEATHVRGEQSAEVLDLRMACLQERLGGLRALTRVLSTANGAVVENAVSATNALGSLDRCADVTLLRSVVRPPEDPATRARVEALRGRLADLKAGFDAGKVRQGLDESTSLVEDARRVGYEPLIAEALALVGNNRIKAGEGTAAAAALEEAYWRADASHDDDVRVEVAAQLVWAVGYLEGKRADSERWARMAEAVLSRVGGHDLVRAWLLNNQAVIGSGPGHAEEDLSALLNAAALKAKVLGLDNPDVGLTEGNIAVALQDLGRNQEALAHVERAIEIETRGNGAEHPDLAIQLSNRGEILNALGRPREARQSFERARIIWERELGVDSRNLAYALTGIGESYLSEGEPASALTALERANGIRVAKETDFQRRGDTAFALARALWEAKRDRVRARVLAESAREEYARAAVAAKLADVDGWLARHPRG
ncbi:MAG: serine/threonine kinase family protein [Myxococcales bacterium]|nr:serine/threonine kinase family protein [Myxococcales bacterium]